MTAERSAGAVADRRWRTAVLAVIGLLVAIALIGVVGIVINRNVQGTVENAIAHDVELEDRGDDLRVAVLEVRHYHRDMLLNNPIPARVELWQQQYSVLLDEIAAMERVLDVHPAREELPDVRELRRQAEDYYEEFDSALHEEVGSLEEFRRVGTALLEPLESIEAIAIAIDQAGERRAAAAFTAIDQATNTGTLILVAVIGGICAMVAVLGLAVLRLVQEQRRLVSVEQSVVAELAAASRAKTDFIADASHELRTPLTVLRGNAEVGLALGAECPHTEILEEIVEESTRMSRLVDDLLFLARSDASSVPLELRETDTADLLTRLVSRAEVLARERGARFASRLDATGMLEGDAARIEQAILILVDNAAKYGPDDGTVEVDAWASADELVIEVRDRGPGIAPEQRSRIFERFYRVDRAGRGRASGGVGLGLSIAAAIVEGHSGRIEALGRDGGGTVMRVVLPARAPRRTAPARPPAEEPAT